MKKFLFLFALTISIAACKKGDTGPAGPAGTNGNANVQTYIYLNQQQPVGDLTINVPAITQSILDKGVVMVYGRKSGTGNGWFILPDLSTSVAISLGTIVIAFPNAASAPPPLDIKVEIIPAP